MKHLILTLALLLSCSLLALAQRGISYQAVILDPKPIEIPGQDITGQPFVNGDVSLKFKLFSATFVQEFEEVHATKTDAYGLVNVLIGSVSQAAFSSLVWDSNSKNLQVWVSFDQGGTYTKVSEQVLTYNPYAFYSETAGTAGKLAGTLGIAAGGTGATTAADARTNLGLGNVDNTSDANKPVSTATQVALDSKANAVEVNSALATKANSSEVNTALGLKANSIDVTAALATKANAADVSASLALKEDVSNKANTPLGTSTTLYPTQNAVKTYVDTQVAGATIADASASTKGKIQLAGDLSGTAAAPTVPGLALKANASEVTSALNTKASSSDLAAGLALKLDANQKGAANGLATLNSSGVIPSSQLPPVTLSSTTVVANATEMLGLSSAIVGSIAIRTDVAKNFVLRALPASTVGNWIELLTPAAPVQTVNGYTGSVNLAKSDLGLGDVDNTADASKPISNAAQQALDLKSNAAEVNAALATKLNTTDALAALNLKANAADVNAGLATKQNTADAIAALNLKSNTADVAAALNLKLDAIKVGIANGTASLDALGKIPTNQIPAISFSSVNVLGSQPEMLALTTAVVGSVVIRTDVNKNYVLAQANPNLLANWIELLTPAPPVQTVNGYTGTVSLTKSDFGLGNVDNTSDANKPISTATQTALDGKVSGDFVAAAVTAGNAANTAAIVTLNSSVATTTQSIAATNLALAQKAPLFKPLKNAEYVMPTSGTITDANSGNIIYSQWSQRPVFPESLSDGFYCTIVNYSGGTITSNTLSTARFYTNTSGYAGSTTFTIPPGGSANVYAVKINGIQRYYVSAGDQSSTFSVANGSITNAKLAGSIAASKLVGTDISSVGTVTTGTWNATAIGLTYGGTGATNAADARTNLGLVIGTNVQAPLAAGTDYLSPSGSAANLTNFPTLNQNTTGNAATATLATTASNVSGLVSGANGGTGVANSGKTITLGGNLQTGHAINFTTTGSSTLSLPVSGTLATVQQVDAKAPLASPALTGTPTAPTATSGDNSTKIATTEFVQAAVSAGNAGLRSIGAISATSNAKGAVISGTSELVLTPADASNGGVVTTGTQTFAGSKTFASNVVANGINVGKGSGGSSTVLGDAASANDNSTALGFMALNGNGGTNNTAVGTNAMRNSSSTSYTTAVGVIAGQNDNTGSDNTFVGYAASVPNSSAISNSTAIGSRAIVTASNTIQLGADGTNGSIPVQNVKTSGTLTAGTVTYPNAHGTNGNVLSTTGTGTLAWTSLSALGAVPSTSTTGSDVSLSTSKVVPQNVGSSTFTNAIQRQYLTVPGNSGFDFGTGNFTIEGWIYVNDYSGWTGGLGDLVEMNDGGSNYLICGITQFGGFRQNWNNGLSGSGGTAASANTLVPLQTWIHFALVRNGDNLTTYLNGVSRITTSGVGAASMGFSNRTLGIGADPVDGNNSGKYNLTNIRIVKGTAVYNYGNTIGTPYFTPPTTIGNIAGTQLLIAPTTATLTDLSPNAFTITKVGSPTFNIPPTTNNLAVEKLATSSLTFTKDGNLTIPSLSTAGIVTNNANGVLSTTSTIALANGGTGAITKTAAFDALSPMTTAGDLIYGGVSGTGTRLTKGSNGTVLTMENDLPTWLTSIRATGGSTYNAAVGFSFLGGDWARNTGMFSDNPDGGGSATLKFRIATSNSTADPYLEISPSKVSVLPITAATSKTTGALTVAGGLGVNGDIYANKLILNSGTAGGASLEVNGASTNTTAFNAASGTSIDFTKSNLAYTSASAGNFTLTGMKDGGTYTLAVQGTSSGTAAFSGSNPSAVSLAFKSVNNAATTANKHTLYTFIVMGTTVYYSMMTGL